MITSFWCVLVLFSTKEFPSKACETKIDQLEYMALEIWIIVRAYEEYGLGLGK